ncbi:transketolase family protein [Candidatus Falkowbacteria bacterium]|nr:transketolase family protein [Candidatus Falkowbacteria bacterium]
MELVPTRDGYGKGLLTLGKTNPRVVALCADLDESTRSQWFAEKYPERFIQMGIGEQNMVLVAAGLANYGKIPFIASYATFSPGRNNEQIRTTVSLSELPVKIAGAHAGVSVGPDGATHQALEDIALMRVQPNMVVICPCDAVEIEKATVAAAAVHGPVYLRFGRAASPVMTTRKTPFKIGCAEIFWTGKDITIIACGQLVYQALLAARALAKDNITAEVINCHTIKPLDEKTIIASVKKTRAVVTVEEHQIAGGLGSAVAETLVQRLPVPMEFVGVRDRFGESGEPDELLQKFGLTSPYIVTAVRKVLKRKK